MNVEELLDMLEETLEEGTAVPFAAATTAGRPEKSDSSSTSWATWLAAWAPDAMAIPQSASFRASTSFTPSPVIATVWPSACNAFTNLRFWAGVTRPNTVQVRTASATFSSVSSVAAST